MLTGYRFVVEGNQSTLPTFENALFGPFTVIIQQEIERTCCWFRFSVFRPNLFAEYIPYVFQVLAQMLNLHTDSVPEQYRPLLSLLFSPAAWQQKGSIPGLVKLLKAFLAKDSAQMVASGQVVSVLAVVQQRLIPSKLNDGWGFDLLQSVVRNVQPYVVADFNLLISHLFFQYPPVRIPQGHYHDPLDQDADLKNGQVLLPIFILPFVHHGAQHRRSFP